MNIYKNGNYTVLIFDDGTKIRRTDDDEFIPAFSECCDVKITDKCSQNCSFCYEGCALSGKHGDLFKYPFVNQLHPYTELALNGNDMDHPDLDDFLQLLKKQHVFANITVNQNQFLKNYDYIKDLQKNGLIHGIGVSLQKATKDFIEKIKTVPNIVLHTINGILTAEDISTLKDNDIKILILGYKDLQRGISYKESNKNLIEQNQKYLYDNLDKMSSWFKVVSFDNLALDQLNVKRLLTDEEWENFYMGDDGGFTFYIDLVKGEFAKNSLSQERFPIGELTIDEMFNKIRKAE